MHIGVGLGMAGTVDEVIERARALAGAGFGSLWSDQIFGWDTLTLLGAVGRAVPDVTLGTAVVPIHPRHPMVLAAQALTVQSLIGGRLVLGVGLSHQVVVEGVWGYSFDRPARYMEEYLEALQPLLAGEQASFQGERIRCATMGPLEVTDAAAPPVLVAALGPKMLEIAARLASGTITWMTGPATIADHTVPTITAAAERHGRPAPEIVVNLPVCITRDVGGARERAARTFAIYGRLPSYRAMLDREGAAGPADVAVVGDEDLLRATVRRLVDGGATELAAVVFGDREERDRTTALLAGLASETS